ncbi:MAG: DJ-1/PfpI family protein [Pseudobutyrivibrio sp.]|nr:DJ-1/PfpI family protein [Pseudobutyrivibrio sp.]
MKAAIFFASGCEEIEGLTVVDVLRRAGMEITMVSITGEKLVTSSHSVSFMTDALFEEMDFSDYDALILPGGMPGSNNLYAYTPLIELLKEFYQKGKLVSAICAAPFILGQLGFLEGRNATCFPGFEDRLTGAEYKDVPVIIDGNVITARGMGAAIDFALAIVEYASDSVAAEALAKKFMYFR